MSARQRLARAHRLRGREDDGAAAEREQDTARSEATAIGIGIGIADSHLRQAHESALASCDRAGRKWCLGLRDTSVLVEDSIGMLHLAVLIGNPRQEIPAVDLVAGLAVLGGRRRQRDGSARP